MTQKPKTFEESIKGIDYPLSFKNWLPCKFCGEYIICEKEHVGYIQDEVFEPGGKIHTTIIGTGIEHRKCGIKIRCRTETELYQKWYHMMSK